MGLEATVDDSRMPSAAPTVDLSEAEERILAALSRRPLGLYPVASVAVAASVEPEETIVALPEAAS